MLGRQGESGRKGGKQGRGWTEKAGRGRLGEGGETGKARKTGQGDPGWTRQVGLVSLSEADSHGVAPRSRARQKKKKAGSRRKHRQGKVDRHGEAVRARRSDAWSDTARHGWGRV
jgi:hypothetical protein